MSVLKAPALREGDTVALIAPSRNVSEERIRELVASLEARGYRVKVSPNVNATFGYLAGTDEARIDAINAAVRDPEVRALFAVAGGFGTTRIIDKLDYEALRNDPKIITGYSDITGIHMAVYAKAGVITFHSPMSPGVFGAKPEQLSVTRDTFWRAIELKEYEPGVLDGYYPTIEGSPTPLRMMAPGVGRGRMVGGNLSLIAATMGTEYEIQTDNNILFLEDVREAPYRVDRMLSTMRLAGKFDNLQGVVIGRFTEYEDDEPGTGFTIDEIMQQYFGKLGVPVIADFPVGHSSDNMTIPVGVLAEINADALTLRFLENPVLTD